MRCSLAGLILLILCSANVVGAADLNAPIETKPTVGSEIRRGTEAAFDCFSRNVMSPFDAEECTSNVEAQNRQRLQAGFEPFSLGAYYMGWFLADGFAFNAKLGEALTAQWHRVATDLFASYRDFQNRLSLTNDQLITAGKFTEKGAADAKARIEFWSR
jgi:hypothetical protein